jgi:hypothetical protein
MRALRKSCGVYENSMRRPVIWAISIESFEKYCTKLCNRPSEEKAGFSSVLPPSHLQNHSKKSTPWLGNGVSNTA